MPPSPFVLAPPNLADFSPTKWTNRESVTPLPALGQVKSIYFAHLSLFNQHYKC